MLTTCSIDHVRNLTRLLKVALCKSVPEKSSISFDQWNCKSVLITYFDNLVFSILFCLCIYFSYPFVAANKGSGGGK